jgi:hypothetical protein
VTNLVCFDFEWHVADTGYQLQDLESGSPGVPSSVSDFPLGMCLTSPAWTFWLPRGPIHQHRSYQPFCDQRAGALFRRFADLDIGAPRSFVAFANNFGPLTCGSPLLTDASSGMEQLGEDIGIWIWGVFLMRCAVKLWDAVRGRDARYLRRQFHHVATGPNYELWSYNYPPGTHPDPIPAIIRTQIVGTCSSTARGLGLEKSLIAAAKGLLAEWIRHNVRDAVRFECGMTVDRNELALSLVPKDLLAGLWLQLAGAIQGRLECRKCLACDNWFEVSREDQGYRRRRTTCSDPCRSHLYRDRKKDARRLHERGCTLKEIAAAVGSTPGTVRGWLKSDRGSR